MPKYVLLANIAEREYQNIQELAPVLGDIEDDVRESGGEPLGAYIMLGDYDFQIIFEAEDADDALEIAFAIQRYGLDTTTHQVADLERLGELAEDI